jgi:NAD+ synthase (glutamine-hydrolysing)
LTSAYKQKLPNYGVFDERRYYQPANSPCVFTYKGVNIGLTICEDMWSPEPTAKAVKAGANLIVSVNASPFDVKKPETREILLAKRCADNQVPIIYVNMIGGQDHLVFDGGSMVFNSQGELTQRQPYFESELRSVDITLDKSKAKPIVSAGTIAPRHHEIALIYHALTAAVKDYVNKNGFAHVYIGLSGGIDSALALAVAVDALSPEHVTAVLMPSAYTSQASIDDAQQQINQLGVNHYTIDIDPIYQSFVNQLQQTFAGTQQNVTEENLQARVRGTLLMALSNKWGGIVLATGNKSELAVGYSTLYGDMVGGYCVLKDVPKTYVYELAEYRNEMAEVIPRNIIKKAPSAELAPGQKDQDSLPPYSILDDIIERFVDHDESAQSIVDAGHDEDTVHYVIKRIMNNEYKRRQAPVGVKITSRAFGSDWRYPMTMKFI